MKAKKCFQYSCKAYGNTFHANRSEDVHRFSSVYPCWKYDGVERSYRCSTRTKNTKLFWHREVHRHHDYATVEEIERRTTEYTLGNDPDYMRRGILGY
jgi:hypothetical protein